MCMCMYMCMRMLACTRRCSQARRYADAGMRTPTRKQAHPDNSIYRERERYSALRIHGFSPKRPPFCEKPCYDLLNLFE